MTRILALLFVLLPALAQAQEKSWPVYENTYVNDYANVIDEDAETRITRTLQVLREETGVEATVLTLYTRWGFETSGSLENFATGLFNHWGIGNAETNDGILILVVSEDREMRIELGSGYGAAFNREAQDIIDYTFIPAFKEDRFSEGIEDGTDATVERIARVLVAGEEPAGRSSGGGGVGVIVTIFAVFGGLIAAAVIFGHRIRDRFSRCPDCGKRGIHTTRHVLEAATRAAAGSGERLTDCPHCGFHTSTSYTIPRITRSSSSSSSGGSFGGGSSSGGGASGRW